MALPSDWKMGKCLEWYTEVPFSGRPRESPFFLIQNIQCCFQLQKYVDGNSSCYYDLYLKPKASHSKLESFSLNVYSDHISTNQLSLNNAFFSDFNRHLLSIADAALVNRGGQLTSGCFIRFFFVFGIKAGPLLPLETKIDDTPGESQNIHLDALSRDMSELLGENSSCDVEIECGGVTYKAHRLILGARCTVFSAMLKSNMIEDKTGVIKVEDIESSIFESFLRYLYSGTLPDMNMDTASQFYEVGDKYAVEELKRACSDFLTKNLTEDNACKVLVYADQRSDINFRKAVISYIIDKKIPQRSEQWANFCLSHSSLAIEVQNLYIQKYCSK